MAIRHHHLTFALAVLAVWLLPGLAWAQTFTPLVGIPGLEGNADFNTYINAVYGLAISLAALLAVIKIIIAGVKYMFTDIATDKGDAKKDIKGAVFGLVLVLSAVLILTVINPDLTRFELNIEQTRNLGPVVRENVRAFEAIVIQEDGYSYIPGTASNQDQLAYSRDCALNGNIIQRPSTGSNEIRCFERDNAALDIVEENLINGDGNVNSNVINSVLNRYPIYINPYEVEENVLVQIQEDLAVTEEGIIFAVKTPLPDGVPSAANGYPDGFESQLEGICSAYAQANENSAIELVYDPQSGYATCVDGS
jgi:hypothetical protein